MFGKSGHPRFHWSNCSFLAAFVLYLVLRHEPSGHPEHDARRIPFLEGLWDNRAADRTGSVVGGVQTPPAVTHHCSQASQSIHVTSVNVESVKTP